MFFSKQTLKDPKMMKFWIGLFFFFFLIIYIYIQTRKDDWNSIIKVPNQQDFST
jgi:hypothetical protein